MTPPLTPHRDTLLGLLGSEGHYVDAWALAWPTPLGLERWVTAFLTSRAFRAERALLALLPGGGSTDEDAMALAAGRSDRFAVWRTVARSQSEVLLADASGRTRSWWMAQTGSGAGDASTLYFGSAILRQPSGRPGGRASLGAPGLTLPLHRMYSQVLMASAAAKLRRQVTGPVPAGHSRAPRPRDCEADQGR